MFSGMMTHFMNLGKPVTEHQVKIEMKPEKISLSCSTF